MATSEQNPSPALLRLHPADVVRLCGLTAAATGLELVASHRIAGTQRDGSRLRATVRDSQHEDQHEDQPHDVLVEMPDDVDLAQWHCDCAHKGPLACAHVAALLSAWIAHPADFPAVGADNTNPRTALALDDKPPRPATLRNGSPVRTPPQAWSSAGADANTIAAALARMSSTDVDGFARRILGADYAEDTENVRADVVAALSDSSRVQALLNRLDSSARALLTLLDLAGGAMTSADLEALALRLALPLSVVQNDVAVLERHMLLLPMLPASMPSQHGPGASWRHVAGWRIPDEVRRAFFSPLPLEVVPASSGSRSAPPRMDSHTSPVRVMRGAPRALCLALALLVHAPPPLGQPQAAADGKQSAVPARYGPGLLAPGEIAPERLKGLAQGAGLDAGVVRLARRLLFQSRDQRPDAQIPDMARLPPSERPVVLRAAFRRWLGNDSAADLLDIELTRSVRLRYATAHPGFRPAAIAKEVSDGRRFIIHLLSHAQPESWYPLDDFVTLAWQLRPGLLRGQQLAWATPAWWLESTQEQRALQPQVRDDWVAAEGAFIHTLIAGACAAWGLVDVAVHADGTLAAFRVTPFGAYLLQRDTSPADATLAVVCDDDWGPPVLPLREGSLAVQPLSAEANVLDALSLWAAPTMVSGGRLVYALAPDRVCAAFDHHLLPETLVGILRPLHNRAAESVAARLNEWHARWGRTRLISGYTLVEASDEVTLVEALSAAPEVAARCQRIGDGLALASPDDAATLRALLARRGYAV
ncbi:MAG: hypothetical protein ACM3N4_02215 [Nitrososphaerota archaeon]